MADQRSLSLRRRDGSWDRRWEASQRGEGGERAGQSRPWTRPGKLNNSYWENRVKSEEAVPARTPPPRRRLVTLASPDPTRYHPTSIAPPRQNNFHSFHHFRRGDSDAQGVLTPELRDRKVLSGSLITLIILRVTRLTPYYNDL